MKRRHSGNLIWTALLTVVWPISGLSAIEKTPHPFILMDRKEIAAAKANLKTTWGENGYARSLRGKREKYIAGDIERLLNSPVYKARRLWLKLWDYGDRLWGPNLRRSRRWLRCLLKV